MMSRNRGAVIRALVTAAAAVVLTLGAAQLSAGTALAATTAHSASAAANATVRPAEATHWIIWSEDIESEPECIVQGETFMEYGLALDFLCSPTVVEGACSDLWTLELLRPGAVAISPAKPAAAAC